MLNPHSLEPFSIVCFLGMIFELYRTDSGQVVTMRHGETFIGDDVDDVLVAATSHECTELA